MKGVVLVALFLTLAATARAADSDEAAESLPSPPKETAGDVSLSEPIAPVPLRSSTWAFALSTLFGIAEPFYEKVVFLGSVRHMTGNWGVEVFGGRAVTWGSDAADVCTAPGSCTTPSAQKLASTPGQLDYVGGASAIWRAAQGKVSVGGLAPFRFALEGSLGAGAVSYDYFNLQEQSAWSPAARAGLGLEASLPRDLSVRLDLQGLFYPSTIRGFNELNREMLLGASFVWQPGRGL